MQESNTIGENKSGKEVWNILKNGCHLKYDGLGRPDKVLFKQRTDWGSGKRYRIFWEEFSGRGNNKKWPHRQQGFILMEDLSTCHLTFKVTLEISNEWQMAEKVGWRNAWEGLSVGPRDGEPYFSSFYWPKFKHTTTFEYIGSWEIPFRLALRKEGIEIWWVEEKSLD